MELERSRGTGWRMPSPWWGCKLHPLEYEGQMNDCTKMVYVVEEDAWWSFTAKQWIALFPVALAGVRSGEGYKLPNTNRLSGRPKCAQRIDGETLGTRIQTTPKSSIYLAGI